MTREVMLQRLINDSLHPTLNLAGFRRRGFGWNRLRDQLIDVIEIQLAKGSGEGNERFTLNLGIFSSEFYRIVWQKQPPRFVEEVDCVVRRRVGDLLSSSPPAKALDKWWVLEHPDDLLRCQREISTSLEVHVLPFLEAFKSASDLHKFLERQPSSSRFALNRLYLAVARHNVGDAEGALRELRDLEANPSAWSQRAEAVERALFS